MVLVVLMVLMVLGIQDIGIGEIVMIIGTEGIVMITGITGTIGIEDHNAIVVIVSGENLVCIGNSSL